MSVIDLGEYRTQSLAPLDAAVAVIDTRLAADPPLGAVEQSRLLREKAVLLTRREAFVTREVREEARTRRQAAQTAAREAKALGREEARAAQGNAVEEFRLACQQWLADREFFYTRSANCFWLFDAADQQWVPMKERAVRLMYPETMSDLHWQIFITVMQEMGRFKSRVTASFKPQPNHILNILHYDFCPFLPGDVHPLFDILISNLADRCPEAKAHLEQVILAKLLNPANYNLPAIVLTDSQGASGKTLLVSTALTTAFGARMVADNVAMSDITGQFNAHVTGKALVFINESVEDKVDHRAMHRLLGSPMVWSETKGVAKIEVENTALYIISGNDPMGSMKVMNSAVDRRISSIKPTRPLVDRIAEEWDISVDDAKLYLREEGVRVLSDREEVGRWLSALRDRHGAVQHVAAFHGAAYRELVSHQRPFHELVFEAIFRDVRKSPEEVRSVLDGLSTNQRAAFGEDHPDCFEYRFTHIRRPLLYMLYRDLARDLNNSYGVLKNRSFYAHLDVWLKREGAAIGLRKVKWRTDRFGTAGVDSSADAYVRTDRMIRQKARHEVTRDLFVCPPTVVSLADATHLDNNDDLYGEQDSMTGRWTWKVTV